MDEEEDDEISDEELAQTYTVLYKKWIDVVKNNETLQAQVLQLSQDKGALEKEVAAIKREISKNNMVKPNLIILGK